MPAQNVTIDDSSALIEYFAPGGQQWTDSPTSDAGLPNYQGRTYHSSILYGAWASLRFQGTAIYLYAAKRSRHGTYNIILDDQLVFKGDGYSANPLYSQIMYSNASLSAGWHNLTCINSDPTNQTYTEVDYITWTTTMPASWTESSGPTIPYTPGNMIYSSLNAWKEDLTGGSNTMATSSDGASVNITFEGNGISLYGVTGPSAGTFSAQVDGYDAQELNAFSQQAHDTLLFRQDNLTNGEHTLTVINRGTSQLAISSAIPVLWSDGNPGSHVSSGVIAGAVVAGVVGLALLSFIVVWVLRRRRKSAREEGLRVHSIHEPAFIDATPFEFPISPGGQSSQVHSPATTRHGKHASEHSQYATYPSQYHAVPGSPGMSSRGSFEYPSSSAGLGAPSSSTGGSSSGWSPAPVATWGAARPTGKNRRPSGATARVEVPEGVEVMRDRDAGPILLPPAYSSAFVSQAPAELPMSMAPSLAATPSPAPIGSISPQIHPGASSTQIPAPIMPAPTPIGASASNANLAEGTLNHAPVQHDDAMTRSE